VRDVDTRNAGDEAMNDSGLSTERRKFFYRQRARVHDLCDETDVLNGPVDERPPGSTAAARAWAVQALPRF
jgi:hypothetical protein